MKASILAAIVILDIIFIGLALFGSSSFTAVNGNGIWSYGGQSSSSTTFANGTAIVFTKEFRIPVPEMWGVGLWMIFAGLILGLDYFIATASFDCFFRCHHRLILRVYHPYTSEEITLEKELFAVRLKYLSDKVAEEKAEEQREK